MRIEYLDADEWPVEECEEHGLRVESSCLCSDLKGLEGVFVARAEGGDWAGPFSTRREAENYIMNTYEVCPECGTGLNQPVKGCPGCPRRR